MPSDPIVHFAANFLERNLAPGQYAGMLVLVQYDPAYPVEHQDDPASNPTGKIYRLRPLSECYLVVNEYGNDNNHWELYANTTITGVIRDAPGRIVGGGASEASFPAAVQHFGPWLTGE